MRPSQAVQSRCRTQNRPPTLDYSQTRFTGRPMSPARSACGHLIGPDTCLAQPIASATFEVTLRASGSKLSVPQQFSQLVDKGFGTGVTELVSQRGGQLVGCGVEFVQGFAN